MDSGRSPYHIFSAQGPNQFACFSWNTWATMLPMLDLPGPVPTETATVPVDYRSGFHDPERRTPSGPELREADPETSISGFQSGFGPLTLKHNNLVSQGEDLRLKIGPAL